MSNIPTHASYLADVARAAHQTGKDLTLEEVAAVIEAVNSLGAADDTLARTGNTARDQEMYAAGIRTGEENAKHNAAIRGCAGWLPIESAPKDGRRVLLWNERYNAAITGQFYGLGGWKLDGEMPPLFHQPTHWMPLPAPPCPTCNGQGAVGNILTAQPCPDCTPAPSAPGDAQDERQAFEAWAEDQGFVLDCDFFEVSGQYYDQDDTQLAYDIWRAARASAPAAVDALDARQLMALADAVVVQWQREDKMPQMAWGFREFLVAGMQALIDSNRTPHGGEGLVDSLARLAYYYAVELESATRNADSDRLEEIARSITAKLKGEIRAAIAAQRKGDA